jgi:hypothetical protein
MPKFEPSSSIWSTSKRWRPRDERSRSRNSRNSRSDCNTTTGARPTRTASFVAPSPPDPDYFVG